MGILDQFLRSEETRAQRIQTLNELSDLVSVDAELHELYDEVEQVEDLAIRRRMLATLIIIEGAELMQSADDPEHYAEELADVNLMTHSTAGFLGIDLGEAIERKRLINLDRPIRHGR